MRSGTLGCAVAVALALMVAGPAGAQSPAGDAARGGQKDRRQGPASLADVQGWLGRMHSAWLVLRPDKAVGEPLAVCPDGTPGPADPRGATVLAVAVRIIGAALDPVTESELQRLDATRPLLASLNLPDRMEEGRVRSATDPLDGFRESRTIADYAWYLQFLRAVFEDTGPADGLNFAAGVAIARLFGSMQYSDEVGVREAVSHLKALRASSMADAMGPVGALVDDVIAAAPDGRSDAKRLRDAVRKHCGALGL